MNKQDPLYTLHQDIEIPKIVQQKAQEAFDQIYFTEESKTNCRKTISVSNRRSKNNFKFFRRKIMAAAAATVFTFTTIGVAAAYFNWSTSLSEILHTTKEQRTQLESNHMASFVNQSCTDQGITVTAMQCITDNYYTHIAFKVEGFEVPDGVQPDFEDIDITVGDTKEFNMNASFYDGLIQGEDGSAVYADKEKAASEEKVVSCYVMDDGSMEYQITLANTKEKGYFINQPIHVVLKNLGTVSKTVYTNEIDGTWTFDWNLEGSEEVVQYTINVPLGDTGATVVNAEISPISIQAELQFPMQLETETYINENGQETAVSFYAEPPELTGVKMKDGTLYPFIYLGPGTEGYQSEDSDLYQISFAVDRILDIDQIESLLFLNPDSQDSSAPEDKFFEVPLESSAVDSNS